VTPSHVGSRGGGGGRWKGGWRRRRLTISHGCSAIAREQCRLTGLRRRGLEERAKRAQGEEGRTG